MNVAMGALLASALTATSPPCEPADLAAPASVLVIPLVHQGVQMVLSHDVTAGGVAAGAGVQLVWQRRYIAQADFNALWGMGSTWSSRLAIGVQLDGAWAPALWGTTTMLFGDRIEMLSVDGRRPAAPSWGLGIRASPLRFLLDSAVFSALEPSMATDFGGAVLFDLTVVQLGARW